MASVLAKGSGIILFIISLLVCIHIILRGFFNSGVAGVYEIVQYGMLIVVSLTLAENELSGGSIVVNFFLDRMKPRAANIFSIIMYTLAVAGIAYVLYNQIGMVFQKYRNGAETGVLHIPHWILAIMICIGLFFFVIALITRVYKMVSDHKSIKNMKLTADEIAASMQSISEF